jgi:hypothetical protein
MALARCILGKFLGVVCHCFPPFYCTACEMNCASLHWRNNVFVLSFVSHSRKTTGNTDNRIRWQCHMENKDSWKAFSFKICLTSDEDNEHSGHNSTDCSDNKVETLRKIANKAHCSILEFNGRFCFPYGTCLCILTVDLKHEAYARKVCALTAYWVTNQQHILAAH